ncbi:MAG: MFS transporter [Nitrospira sp.]|jgi:MFS family permease|nr:MFS transporter [Nitrospira sp.]
MTSPNAGRSHPTDAPLAHDSGRRFGLRDGLFQATTQGAGEQYLSAFALLLHATPVHLGLLSALPQLLGTWAQFISVKVSHWFPSRKSQVLWGILGQSLAWMPILGLPLLFPQWGPELLVAGAALYFGCAHFTTPAWTGLITNLLQANERGAYFARRSQLMAVAGFAALCLGGVLLSLFAQRHQHWIGFAVLFLIAGGVRSLSAHALTTVTDLPIQPDEPADRHFMIFLRHGTSSDFRHFLIYSGLMHVAVLISGPFFVMYLLQDLHLPYWEYGTWLAAAIVGQFITLPGWGRFSDRFGNKALLTFTGFLVSFLPMLYLVSSTWLFLVTLNFFGGVVWAGLSLGLSNYVFDAVRPEDRAKGVAVSSTVNAIGWAIGTLTGSWLISTVPGSIEFGALGLHPASNLPFIFFISGVLRLLISSALLRTFREPRQVEHQSPSRLFWELPLLNSVRRWALQRPHGSSR